MTAKYQTMPALADHERRALTESISRFGVQSPVVVDENGEIIDGHHRWAIASHLAVECPRRITSGLSEADKIGLSISLNVDRRHLTREQQRDVIALSLKAAPELSDRQHAERTGASHPTVASVRSDLVQSGDVENLSTRTDTSGRQQPIAKVGPTSAAPAGIDKSRHAVRARVTRAKEMAAVGNTSRQIAKAIGIGFGSMPEFRERHGVDVPADATVGRTREFDSTRIVNESVLCVAGVGMLFDQIDYTELDTAAIDGWVDVLNESIRSLTTLRNNLKELTQP